MRTTDRTRRGSAGRIVATYALLSAVWILFSDLLVANTHNPRLITVLSISKGWIFVLATSLLLYGMIRRTISHISHTEARERLILDSVNDAIFIYYLREDGEPGRFIDANETALHRLGYTLAELQEMTPVDLAKPGLRSDVRAAAERLLKVGQVLYQSVLIAKDGRRLSVEVSSRTVPIGDDLMAISVARDIAERKRAERYQREAELATERDKRRFYRETILAVTGGKFELGEPSEARHWVQDPQVEIHVTSAGVMTDARHEALDYCRREGLAGDSVKDFELAIGEALGNAVKHAGEGWLYGGKRDDAIWMAVIDHGKGIDTFILPKVALLAGFSTEASMGLGYTMILRVCDHVKLATGPQGTTVVMEKLLQPRSDAQDRLGSFEAMEWPK